MIGPQWTLLDNLYVADMSNSRIRKINTVGLVETVAIINQPTGVAIDKSGNIYAVVRNQHLIDKPLDKFELMT